MIETTSAVFAKMDGVTGHERIGTGPILLFDVIRELPISAAISVQDAHLNDVSRMVVDLGSERS